MIYSVDEQTIIARCTPPGKGAIALLRLSGVDCLHVADGLARLASGKKLSKCSTHTIQYGWVVDGSAKTIDQVLFLLMKAPRTFTGQDTVEITCHNNPLIVEAIIARAVQLGARPAREGEFTKRAVLNEKIDLLQAEAIHEVIVAQNSKAVSASLEQLQGSLSMWVQHLQQQIIELVAFTEASFEFLDEELTFDTQILQRLDTVITQLQKLLKDYDAQQQVRQGLRIALLGSVNAGKSSLFNVFVKQQRAIVTDIAGTTRDTIECTVTYADTVVTFVDTAGLRQTEDIVEQHGITRSFEQAVSADIILLVYDSSRQMTQSEQQVYNDLLSKYSDKIIVVHNKIDACDQSSQYNLAISTKTERNIKQLHAVLQEKIADKYGKASTPYLINQRQYEILSSCLQQLCNIHSKAHQRLEYELFAADVKIVLEQLGDLTGHQASEACLDAVFKGFCVGK